MHTKFSAIGTSKIHNEDISDVHAQSWASASYLGYCENHGASGDLFLMILVIFCIILTTYG